MAERTGWSLEVSAISGSENAASPMPLHDFMAASGDRKRSEALHRERTGNDSSPDDKKARLDYEPLVALPCILHSGEILVTHDAEDENLLLVAEISEIQANTESTGSNGTDQEIAQAQAE